MAPHAWHVPSVNSVEHMVFGAVQVLLKAVTQQGWDSPPQVPHIPAAQVADGAPQNGPQSEPTPTQMEPSVSW